MEERFRTQSAMVLMAFERAVGDVVKANVGNIDELPKGLVKKIYERNKGLSSIDDLSVEQLINYAYFDEIVEMSIQPDCLQHLSPFLVELKNLASSLDIYSIRNKFAHPNHPFLETYWYRVAAFATDPAIGLLPFDKVTEAFQRASAGTLDEIPDDWLQVNRYELPNNLPDHFGHEITGLLGRKNEISELTRRLLRGKFPIVAVVAPGGIGKTALGLEVLRQISLRPDTAEKFDRILYFSAKRHALTLDGTKQLNSIETFVQLSYEIATEIGLMNDDNTLFSANELITIQSNERVLLCIDNVETFLIEDTQAFHDFFEMLPETWKVLVTSRIPIDAASTLSLRELEAHDGKLLGRVYARNRGIQIEDEQVQSIPPTVLINPLAVRLVVDGFGRGKPIEEMANETQGQILDFSYSNLIDTLNDEAILVLEALIAQPRSDRRDIERLTGLQDDSVAEALSQLSRTSLLRQQQEDEGSVYQIADGVRDLILTNQRNFTARGTVNRRLTELDAQAKQAMVNQAARGINEYHWAFLPPGSSDFSMQKLSRIWPKISKCKEVSEMAQIKRDLDSIFSLIAEKDVVYAYYAFLHMKMQDYSKAHEYIQKSIDLSNGKPRYRMVLARLLGYQNRHDEQIEVCRILIEEIGVDPNVIGEGVARLLLMGYFLSHIYSGRFDQVIEETSNWRENINRNMLGLFRASAIKRASEHMRNEDAIPKLSKCMEILEDVIEHDGYASTTRKVLSKIIEDFAYRLNLPISVDAMSPSETLPILKFCDHHLDACFDVEKTGERRRLVEIFSSVDIESNPFFQSRYQTEDDYAGTSEASGFDQSGYINVEVYHIPNSMEEGSYPRYLFAKDSKDVQYFLYQGSVSSDSSRSWYEIREGDRLKIKPDTEKQHPGKAVPVSDILL